MMRWLTFLLILGILATRLDATTLCDGSGPIILKPQDLKEPKTSDARCIVDLDALSDGLVGATDLNQVLGNWNGEPPAGDLDGDGRIGCFDLEIVLARWGTCPNPDVNDDGTVDCKDQLMLVEHEELDCRRDLNRDGCVDEVDLETFTCLVESGHPLADLDRDGKVNLEDRALVEEALGMDCRGDVNGDGVIGWSDVVVVVKGGGGRE